jgi:hypothetical protein
MATMTKTQTAAAAGDFLRACRQMGWRVDARENIVTITRYFDAGDHAGFAECDSQAYELLSQFKTRRGSIWGTDGGSVGGYSAMLHGRYVLNVSGVNTRMVAEINRRQDSEID